MRLQKARQEIRHWHEEFILQFHKDDHQFMHHLYMKYDHTQRVVNEVRGICEALNLSVEQSLVAELSALFHDLGRYVEVLGDEDLSTDESNHAHLSVAILKREDALNKLPAPLIRQIYEVIYYHNCVTIPTHLSSEVAMILEIVRDSDKIDIWRMISTFFTTPALKRKELLEINVVEGESVKKSLLALLEEQQVIPSELVTNTTELKLQYLSWVYDLNTLWAAQVVEKRQYLSKLAATLPQELQDHFALKGVLEYLTNQAVQAQAEGFRGR